MNLSAIPEVIPSTEAATATAAALPGGAPVVPGLDFAALFLAALGLVAAPVDGVGETPAEPSGETPAADAPKESGDATALAASAAGTAAAAALLVPAVPATTAQGEAPAETGPAPTGTANTPIPVVPPTGQQPAATSDAVVDAPATANPVPDAQAAVPEAAPDDATPGDDAPAVASVPAAAKPVSAAPIARATHAPDPVETPTAAPADDAPVATTAVKTDTTADATSAESAGTTAAAQVTQHVHEKGEVADGNARERVSAAGKPAEATHAADVRPARADAELAHHGGEEHHDGERELGRRETVEALRSGGGPDPSAPSPLPPTTRDTPRLDGIARHERLSGNALAGTLPHDVERLVRLDAMRASGGSDSNEMRLELATDGLGRVDVRVAVRADAVHASLFASHDVAREALEAHRPSLEAALERSNLRLEGFNVALGQQGRDHGADLRDQGQGTAVPRSVPVAPVSAAAGSTEPIRPVMTAGGLSLRA